MIAKCMASALLKFFTFPIAFVYFRIRFGKDFFRKPEFCYDCNEDPVNGTCPKCGWVIRHSPYGRYMSGADMGMFEFASYEAKSIAKLRRLREERKASEKSSTAKVKSHEPPVDLTSILLDD